MGLFSRLPAGAKAVKPRLYDTVDRATSEYLSAPNFALNADVVATISGAMDPTYASTKACKRLSLRLRTRNQRVQHLALQVAEDCVRSCGDAFHAVLARSDLIAEMARMADRSVWCASNVQVQVLALLQEWAYALRQPEFSTLYNKLKARGLPFPPRDGAAAQQFQPYPGLSPPPPGYGGGGGPPPTQPLQGASPRRQQAAAARPESRGSANLGPDLLSPQRSPQQLAADLETARTNVSLLTEVLDGAEAERNWGAAKEGYCGEVAAACSAITTRLATLLGSGVSDESVTATALEVNEQAQQVLDRRSQMVAVAEGRREAPPPHAAPAVSPAAAAQPTENGNGHGAAALSSSAVEDASAAAGDDATATSAPAPVAAASGPFKDLLDLDWPPQPEYPAPAAPAPFDAFAGPQPIAPPPSNNPFAPKPPSALPPPPLAAGTAPAAASPPAAPAAASPPAVAANPFMSDSAFASVHSAPPPPPSGASGNPFAAAPPEPRPSFKRPPPVIVPSEEAPPAATAAHHSASPSPYGYAPSPAYPTPHSVLPSAHSAYGPQHSQQQQQGLYPSLYSATSQGPSTLGGDGNPFLAPTPAFHAPTPVTSRPVFDAFGDLVSLAPKKEAPPPPPKGVPMRGGGGSSQGDLASQGSTPRAGSVASLRAEPCGQAEPAAAVVRAVAAPRQAQVQAPAASVAAFDAFDSLATSR